MLFLADGSHKPTWTERKGGERGGGHGVKQKKSKGRMESSRYQEIRLLQITICATGFLLDYIRRILTAVYI